jgi:hypothetical protein
VSHPFAKRPPGGISGIDVNFVVIARYPGEGDNISLGNGSTRGRYRVANGKLFKLSAARLEFHICHS